MPGFPLIRTVAHCFRTISSVMVDLLRLAFLSAHTRRSGCGEPLPSQTTGALPGAQSQTTTSQRFHAFDDGDAQSHVPVARCAGECPSGYTHPLASQRIPAVLALE